MHIAEKKSFKILGNGVEAVDRGRTENTMAKRKGKKDKQCSTNHYIEN